MNSRPISIFLATYLMSVGCASKRPTPQAPESVPSSHAQSETEQEERVDILNLARFLNLDRPVEQLGFTEKSFNTCRVGYGYSSSRNCRQKFLVAINFRLQCRDSEGTVNLVTDEELRPVTSNQVTWTLNRQRGTTSTDGEGYGQVRAIVPRSSRTERLRLSVANDFLIMRTGDVKRIVVPRPWCE